MVDLSKLKLDRWFDPSTRNWICTLRDAEGNQVGDSIVVGDRRSAMDLKKEDFNVDPSFEETDEEDRYGFNIPAQYRRPIQKLFSVIRAYPGKLQVWDTKTKDLMFTILSVQSATLVSTKSPRGKGVCGVLSIVKGLESRQSRLWLVGKGEVTYRSLITPA